MAADEHTAALQERANEFARLVSMMQGRIYFISLEDEGLRRWFPPTVRQSVDDLAELLRVYEAHWDYMQRSLIYVERCNGELARWAPPPAPRAVDATSAPSAA